MGHFGAPIAARMVFVVFPALIVNYFGQGAMLPGDPSADQSILPQSPGWGLNPMVVVSTVATVIASQAVISGAFSVTHQAIQLGFLPRLQIRHTRRRSRAGLHPGRQLGAARHGRPAVRLPLLDRLAPPMASR